MTKIVYKFLFLLFPLVGFSQYVQLGNTLVADVLGDQAGYDVKMNSAGDIIAFSARFSDNGSALNTGQVQVYKFENSAWNKLGTTINGDSFEDNAGRSISLSDDGLTIVVGSHRDDNNGNTDAGHVRIFRFISGSWQQLGSDIDGISEDEFFGFAVELSSDGNTLAAGAYRNATNGLNSGYVKVFEFNASNWSQKGNTLFGAQLSSYGFNLSISGSGNRLAVGATRGTFNGENTGGVKVYDFISNTWQQVGQDLAGVNSGDLAGNAVVLNKPGNIVAVGSNGNNENGDQSGEVRVFELIGNNAWQQKGQDINGDFGDELGNNRTIALSIDGNVMALARNRDDTNGFTNNGSVTVYRYVSNSWQAVNSTLEGEATNDYFGSSVGLNSSGERLIVGAYNTISGGSIYIYENSNLLSREEISTNMTNIKLMPNPNNGDFEIELKETQTGELIIHNYLGKLIFKQSFNSIKIEVKETELKSGLYFVTIRTKNNLETIKMIVD